MQLRLPWPVSRKPAGAPTVSVDGRTVPVWIARHRRARRYIVRLDERGHVRLTVPRGASIAGGLAFAAREADWLAREWRQRVEQARPWTTGTCVWYRGERVALVVRADSVDCAGHRVALAPSADVRAALEAAWRERAGQELAPRARELATETGTVITGVSVRNQRSRWGSCSARRLITLNWRLLLMPASVSDYVIYHELMHVRQPNHSRRFWREVDAVCPAWRDSERWLRKFGRQVLCQV